MSLSKSKCQYANNCLYFLKRAVSLITAAKSLEVLYPGKKTANLKTGKSSGSSEQGGTSTKVDSN
jgi:hypothetical protein